MKEFKLPLGRHLDGIGGGILATLAILLVFCLPWWNRTLGLSTEGWFPFYAHQFSQGLMPYRDFYLFSTPGHVLECSLVKAVFGDHLIGYRVAGLIQRLVMGAVLFLWLRQVVHRTPAALAASWAAVLYSTDTPDVLFYINHSCVFWALLSCLCTSFFIRRSDPRLLLLSGIFAFFSFFTKQTIGAGLSMATAAFLALPLLRGDWRRPVRDILVFVGGWWIFALLAILWLASQDALAPFWDQIFGSGKDSKGSLGSILIRPFRIMPAFVLVAAMIALLALLFRRKIREWRAETPSPPSLGALSLLLCGLSLAGAGAVYLAGGPSATDAIRNIRDISLIILIASVGSTFYLLVACLWKFFRRGPSDKVMQWLWLSGAGVTVWLFFGISLPLFEAMAIPATAILAAAVFHGAFKMNPARAPERHLRTLLICLLLSGFFLLSVYRCTLPFFFVCYDEPPVSTPRTDTPGQWERGYRLSRTTSDAINTIIDVVHRESRPDDTVFIFPHLPYLYRLVERKPDTFAYVHWLDVAPDRVVARDLARLRSRPPRILIYQDLEQGLFDDFEKTFRPQPGSSQREMLNYLRNPPGYTHIAEIPLNPMSSPIQIWKSNGTATPGPQLP